MTIYTKKKCKQCGISKVLTDFPEKSVKNSVVQYGSVCNDCISKKIKVKVEKTKETKIESMVADTETVLLSSGLFTCRVCGEIKPLSEYYKDRVSNGIQRHRSECKACSKKASNERTKKYNDQKKQLINDFTEEQWQEACNYFDGHCAYCGTGPIEDKDHVVPVCDGGGFTASNILPSCHRCNASKGPKHMARWLITMPWYTPERLQKIVNYLKTKKKSS